jgi:tape measure domain-containing protein
MADVVLGIKIKSDGSAQVTSDINRLNASIAQTQRHARDTAQGVAGLSSALNAVKNAAIGFAGISLGAGLAKDILNTNRSMEGLRSQLTAITGSQADAQRTFKFIQDFAVNTPFEIDGLTKAYIKLQNFGIRPTAQVMEAITNQAAKLGGSQETLEGITTALGQAYAKGKLQAEEMMQLAERGVPIFTLLSAAIGKNTAELQDMAEKGQLTRDVIDQVIVKMGELASGSNAAAMDTLNGKISNLSDSWARFEDTLLNSQGEGIIKNLISSVTDLINVIERDLSNTVDAQIAHAEARINTFKSMGFVGQALADYTGYDIGIEVNRRDSLKKQQTKQQAAARQAEIVKNSAAEIAKTQQWLDDIDAETAEKQKKRSKDKETHARSAASAAESAAKQAAKAYQTERDEVAKTLAAIQQETQLIGLSDTARARSIELQNALTKAKGAEVEQIRAALAVKWAMADAESVVKASQEAQIQAINEQVDRYQQLTLSVRELYAEKLKQAGLSDQQAAPVLARFDQNKGLEANAEKTNQAKQALDSYIQSLDSAAKSSQNFGDVSSSIFDSSLGGINTLAGAFDSLTKRISDTTEELRKNTEAQALNAQLPEGEERQKNAIKLQKQQQTLERQQIKDQLSGIRQMASATANMYAQNTNARRAFNVVALAASVAERAADLAGLGAKAASAVLTQGQGDPYTAFARIAAMAAIVGSVLSAAGAGTFQFGGSGKVAKLDTAPDSGTVLGDPTAQSESIDNVYGLLQDIHAREYRELQGINQGVTNLKQGITNSLTNLFQSGGLKSVTLPPSSYVFGPQNIKNRPYVSPITAALEKFIFGGLFGRIKYEVTGQGVLIGKTLMSKILEGAEINAQQYTEITKTKKSWFSTKTTVEEILSPLDTGVRSGLTQIFKGMGQSMLSMADSFGLDVTQNILSYKIPDLRVDLTDLNGTQAAKKLNNVLSTQLDRMTGKIFDDLVKQYQKMGEGLFETASRLKIQNAVVKDALASSGQSYNGDITRISDGLSTLFGSIKDFSSQFQDYFSAFYTKTEQVADAKRRLDAVFTDSGNLPASREAYRDLARAQDLSTIAGRQLYFQLIDLAGAADEYYSAQEDLAKNAESGLRNLAGLAPTLRSEIYNLNLSLIDARANWHAAGLDLTEMSRLTGLAFAELKTKILNPFTSARDEIATSLAGITGKPLPVGDINAMIASLKTMTDPTQAINQTAKIQKALKTRYDNEVSLITKVRQSFGSIKEFLDSLLLGNLSVLSPEEKLKEAHRQYQETLVQAQSGNTDALNKITGVAQSYITVAREFYASDANYAQVVDTVQTSLQALISTANVVDAAKKAAEAVDIINLAKIGISGSLTTLQSAFTGITQDVMQSSQYTVAAKSVVDTARETMTSKLSSLNEVFTGLANGTRDSASATQAANQIVSESKSVMTKALTDINTLFVNAGNDASLTSQATSAALQVVNAGKDSITKGIGGIDKSMQDISAATAANAEAANVASGSLEYAMDSANSSMASSLQILDTILAGFVQSLGVQFDEILGNTTTPSPVTPTPVTPQKTTYDTLVENRAAKQKVIDDAKSNGLKNKDLVDEIAAATVANNQYKNYMFWHELGNEDMAVKSIQDTADYYEILKNTKDKSLRKVDRQWYKEMLPAYDLNNGGTVKFRASGGMTSGHTVFNEAGPELLNFTHPTMITNNRDTQSIISLGNKQAVSELEKQTKELQALVRLQQASIQAMLERLDKANENTEAAARAAKLKALAAA